MNNLLKTPLLSPEEIELIKTLAPASENGQQLHPDLLELVFKKGWFRVFVEENNAGNVYTIPEMVALEEQLAMLDGSLGWTVTLCSGAGWFAGFLDPDVKTHFFTDKHMCIAGSGSVSGTATLKNGGYVVNGIWKYATGAPHGTAYTANCVLMDGDTAVLNPDGTPCVRAFIFEKEEVRLLHTWNSIGMVASASHGFEIKDLFIPAERSFRIEPAYAKSRHLVYQYPFLQLAETTLAANISGMMLHFLDLCKEGFGAGNLAKKFPPQQVNAILAEFKQAVEEVETYRQEFYSSLQLSWEFCVAGGNYPAGLLYRVSSDCRKLAHAALRWKDVLFPYGGLFFADTTTEVNRVWRDLHTAGQHALLVRDLEE